MLTIHANGKSKQVEFQGEEHSITLPDFLIKNYKLLVRFPKLFSHMYKDGYYFIDGKAYRFDVIEPAIAPANSIRPFSIKETADSFTVVPYKVIPGHMAFNNEVQTRSRLIFSHLKSKGKTLLIQGDFKEQKVQPWTPINSVKDYKSFIQNLEGYESSIPDSFPETVLKRSIELLLGEEYDSIEEAITQACIEEFEIREEDRAKALEYIKLPLFKFNNPFLLKSDLRSFLLDEGESTKVFTPVIGPPSKKPKEVVEEEGEDVAPVHVEPILTKVNEYVPQDAVSYKEILGLFNTIEKRTENILVDAYPNLVMPISEVPPANRYQYLTINVESKNFYRQFEGLPFQENPIHTIAKANWIAQYENISFAEAIATVYGVENPTIFAEAMTLLRNCREGKYLYGFGEKPVSTKPLQYEDLDKYYKVLLTKKLIYSTLTVRIKVSLMKSVFGLEDGTDEDLCKYLNK